MNTKNSLKAAVFIAILYAGQISADILVVVNTKNETSSLSKYELIDLYMGRFRTFPNRLPVKLYDHDEESSLRNQFYRQLIDKSVAEVNAFWARLLFTGRAKPPKIFEDNDELFNVLVDDTQAIAYINEQDLRDNMKIVYRIPAR